MDTLNRRLAQSEQSNAEVQNELNAVADHLKTDAGPTGQRPAADQAVEH